MTFTFEPEGYQCPFCRIANPHTPLTPAMNEADIIYRDEAVTVVLPLDWLPTNHGHTLIVPTDHYENIIAIPDRMLGAVHSMAKRVAQALLDLTNCDGITMLQHNGPAGNQDVWHYHLHCVPRFTGDEHPVRARGWERTTPEQRLPYAEKLRTWFERNLPTTI